MPCCPKPPLPSISIVNQGEKVTQAWCGSFHNDARFLDFKHYVIFKQGLMGTFTYGCPGPDMQYTIVRTLVDPAAKFFGGKYTPFNGLCNFTNYYLNSDFTDFVSSEDAPCPGSPPPRTYHCPGDAGFNCYATHVVLSEYETFEDEYTEDRVIADAKDLFTGAVGIGDKFANAACTTVNIGSFYVGGAVTLSRLYPKITHTPSVSCYLKVWYEVVDQNNVVRETRTYVWTGGSPSCALPNSITANLPMVDYPAKGDCLMVRTRKFSILNGYTPPDDGSANGYPI